MSLRPIPSALTRFRLLTAIFSLSLVAQGYGAAPPQSSSDDLYNQAVQAYGQNRFSDARAKFEQIQGAHEDDAKLYVTKIKAYTEAMQVANGVVQRSPDELDAASMDFAIQKYEEAIKIKPEGPWNPQQQLERAKALRAKLVQQTAAATEVRDHNLCEKTLAASRARHYGEAVLFSCPLANDNPAYLCGGDEATHICQQMREFAKASEPSAPNPIHSSSSGSSAFELAQAAYQKNDFDRARVLFRRVGGDEKPSADEYLDKMTQYQATVEQAAKMGRELKYDEARGAFQYAAKIKADGPGNPEEQAARMDLAQGIDEFYSGNYVPARQHLEAYALGSTQNRSLVYFYLGASKLGRYFLTGSEDPSLREQALTDLKTAKEAGFKPKGMDISPKILTAYEQLTF